MTVTILWIGGLWFTIGLINPSKSLFVVVGLFFVWPIVLGEEVREKLMGGKIEKETIWWRKEAQ